MNTAFGKQHGCLVFKFMAAMLALVYYIDNISATSETPVKEIGSFISDNPASYYQGINDEDDQLFAKFSKTEFVKNSVKAFLTNAKLDDNNPNIVGFRKLFMVSLFNFLKREIWGLDIADFEKNTDMLKTKSKKWSDQTVSLTLYLAGIKEDNADVSAALNDMATINNSKSRVCTLDFSNAPFSYERLKNFLILSSISALALDNCGLMELSDPNIFANCEKLNVISLKQNGITKIEGFTGPRAEFKTIIAFIDLTGNPICSINPKNLRNALPSFIWICMDLDVYEKFKGDDDFVKELQSEGFVFDHVGLKQLTSN